MKITFNFKSHIFISFMACATLTLNSCSKENADLAKVEIIDPFLKELVIQTGFVESFVIKSDVWSISYVKDGITGEIWKDSDGNPMQLNSSRTIRLKDKWLEIEKTKDNKLGIALLENFTDIPRNFVIGIQSHNQHQEEMHFIQSRGEHYELVEKEIEEIEGSRKIYMSTEGCSTITIANNTNQEKKMETSVVYKDVKYRSEFSSKDYGAFDWINKKDSAIFMDELMRDGSVVWANQVPYSKGITYENFMKSNGSKEELTLRPYTSAVIKGEIEYLERSSTYTFTIQNKTSGNKFKISGIWSQKIPLMTLTSYE